MGILGKTSEFLLRCSQVAFRVGCDVKTPYSAAMARADVAVVGLGVVGSAVLMHLARAGMLPAIGMDQFRTAARARLLAPRRNPHSPPGGGRRRGVRAAGAPLAPNLARAGARNRPGAAGPDRRPADGPARGRSPPPAASETVRAARRRDRAAVRHRARMLDAAEVMRRFPAFTLRGDELGYFEPEAGMLFPETLRRRPAAAGGRAGSCWRPTRRSRDMPPPTACGSRQRGASSRPAAPWSPPAPGCPACWAANFPPCTAFPARCCTGSRPTTRRIWHPENSRSSSGCTATRRRDYVYGFPTAGSAEVKLATEQYAATSPDPDAATRTVDAAEAPRCTART